LNATSQKGVRRQYRADAGLGIEAAQSVDKKNIAGT
jgi:hypothetical protein